MPDRPSLDLVIKNVRLVRPRHASVEARDLGVVDGRFARVEPVIDASEAREIYDARGRLGFPGVVDAHTHVGIYAPLGDDAVSESKAAVSGGTTTVLTYFRTGQYYLNQGGPYAAFFPRCWPSRATATGATTPITWPRSSRGTSARWSGSPPSRACRRSRSSCSTAATGSTARPTARPSAGS